ncbi:hypothetical protein [Lysinibacillus fusiformis]|uniref:hypothetical protein n=1 Tax=Lysinibacillus fusiformis TaxID=28031 RepID=UPI00215B0DF4|nr:hypothetical protein [Lysinibacillus fusiformis]MCR8852501.1 hypothetical protein [Lysinibacillus fusiformis]
MINKSNIYKALLILLPISLLLNLFFVVKFTENNSRKQEYFIYNLNLKLYELNLAINNQKENDWQDPQIVMNPLEKVKDILVDSVITNNFASSVLNDEEKKMLQSIYNFLEPLPKSDLLEVGKWEEADTEYILRVGEALSLSNYTANSFPVQSWSSVVKQWEQLVKAFETGCN